MGYIKKNVVSQGAGITPDKKGIIKSNLFFIIKSHNLLVLSSSSLWVDNAIVGWQVSPLQQSSILDLQI